MNTRFLVAGIVMMSAAACVNRPHVLTQAERATAEIGARAFNEANDTLFVGCFGKDINGDGGVTCAVKGKADGVVQDITCSYQEGSQGCKRGRFD